MLTSELDRVWAGPVVYLLSLHLSGPLYSGFGYISQWIDPVKSLSLFFGISKFCAPKVCMSTDIFSKQLIAKKKLDNLIV